MKAWQTLVLGGAMLLFLVAASSEQKDWKLPPDTARLKPGPGVELVTAQCIVCHSLDYISTQPPVGRAAWQATVVKMKEKYGAPVAPEHVDAIVSYLAKNYGVDETKSGK